MKPATSRRRIFIVDDHPLVRESLLRLLSGQSDLEVCGEAEGLPDGLDGITRLSPDMAIVDLSLRQSNGLELIKELRARDSAVPVLVLSMHDEALYAERVLKAGGQGYISKQEPGDEILRAIRKVLDGEIHLSAELAGKLLRRAFGPGVGSAGIEGLADRELEVFELLGKGLGTRKIAETLSLSPKTVETYRARIKEKLGLQDSVELMQRAVQWAERYGARGGLS